MAKKPDEYSEAEAKRRFEQALKGAAKVPAKTKGKTRGAPPKQKRPARHSKD
jgi:hypothetical protein